MGRTVPTYREILKKEKEKWQDFKNSLKERERKAFERLLENCEIHVSAGSQVKSPNPFREMTMSILLEQQKEIISLRKELDWLKEQLEE